MDAHNGCWAAAASAGPTSAGIPDASGPEGLHLLEVNTQPGMTPLSLVPEQAHHCDIPFNELVSRLVEDARCDR